MNEGEPFLQVSGLTVSRAGSVELDRFSMTIQPGETVVVLGEAACGHDALLRVLGGFAEKDEHIAGTIRFAGHEARPATRRLRPPLRTAYLPSPFSRPFAPHVSALSQMCRIVARKLGAPLTSAREELRLALERLPGAPTPELLDCKPPRLDALSMAWGLLATAVAETPEFLLADHAFADLGPIATRTMLEALCEEKKRLGFTLLYVTGGLQPVARLGGRVLVMRQGRIVEEGDASRLMSGHTHAYTRTLFEAMPQLSLEKPATRKAARGQSLIQVHALALRPPQPEDHSHRDTVTFEIRRGASLALVGEQGSGRRHLMRLMLGLEHPLSGRVVFDAVNLNVLSEPMVERLRRRVAFITGTDEALDPRMSIWATVEEPLRAHLHLSRDLVSDYRDGALKRVGLASHDGKRVVGTLSAFDKRRLQVARAIVGAPLLAVIDEPLLGLDAYAQTILREVLKDFRGTQGPAFLVITSDFTVAQDFADDAMVFHGGRVIERGPIADILRDPHDPATRALIEAVTLGSAPALPHTAASV